MQKWMIEHMLYPAMESLRGNHVREYVRGMQQSAQLSPEELRTMQGEKLKALLRVCASSVPAYAGLGLTDEDIERDPFTALRRVPLLEKRTFQASPDAYVSTACDRTQLIANKTGGSTGRPLEFYMDRYDVEHYEAARWRGLSWWGISYGSRSIMIWGNPIELTQNEQKASQRKEKLLKNRTVISAYGLTPEKADEYVRFLNRYQPEYLYGYATALAAFAGLLLPVRDKLKLRRLRAAVSTSETLHDGQREIIASAFSCPVVNEYGARDAGILGYECCCGRMHMSAENVLMEIVDPVTCEPVQDGQSGLVVTTDLNNLVQPRLRYLLGDTATLAPREERCGCGVRLPQIASLDGREDTLFRLPDGRLVHGNFANQLTRKYHGIAQFQLAQTDVRHAELRVVLRGAQAEHDAEVFRADVAEHLPGVDVTLRTVDALAPGASGKFRYSIREFEL